MGVEVMLTALAKNKWAHWCGAAPGSTSPDDFCSPPALSFSETFSLPAPASPRFPTAPVQIGAGTSL